MSQETILHCRSLVKRYTRKGPPAVDGLDLEITKGSVFGYLGPNGAGKTTTIKLMTGLLRPTAGSVEISGSTVTPHSLRVRSMVGYLSEDPIYYTWMTGYELLLFVGRLFGLSSKDAAKRTDELLELTDLAYERRKRIRHFSKGMLQRIGIAQALVARPKLLFLDEPVTSLDPMGRKEVLDLIDRLRAETTVFMSTHILADADRVCDHIGIIRNGRLILSDRTAAVKQRFAPPVLEVAFAREEDARAFVEVAATEGWKITAPESEISETGATEYTVRLSQQDFEAVRAEVLRIIADRRLSLRRFEMTPATLEDVFIRMMRDDLPAARQSVSQPVAQATRGEVRSLRDDAGAGERPRTDDGTPRQDGASHDGGTPHDNGTPRDNSTPPRDHTRPGGGA